MSSPERSTRPEGFNLRALPILIAALVIAGGASFFSTAMIQLTWCGFSGCAGPRTPMTADRVVITLLGCVASGLAWLAAVALPTWWRPSRTRWRIAAVAAVVSMVAVLSVGTYFFSA